MTLTGSAWSYALVRLAGLFALAVVGGLIFGHLEVWVVTVVSGYLVLQLTYLYQVHRWLRFRSTMEPPDLGGVWGDVIALVIRIYRRKQFHKRRIVDLFREFRRMTTAMPDGVIVLNANREILWFNRPAALLLGLRRKVDFGQRLNNLLRHPDFIQYLEGHDFAAPVIVPSPLSPEAFLAVHAVSYGAGQQLLVVRNVTRQIRLESMRKEFVANASHELRSPLTVISGYLDTLVDDPELQSVWGPPLAEMRRQTDRMRALVNDLLELSTLEASTGEAPDDLVDVVSMLKLMRQEVLGLEVHPRSVTLEVTVQASLMGSEAELHSIFWNLISNAVKYTPAEGFIHIAWKADSNGAKFIVQDSGIGIAEAHLPRLTERFYRVDPGRARKTGGSGLGLSIVKHALTRHAATLEIDSIEGQGSVFTCHFPARRVVLH